MRLPKIRRGRFSVGEQDDNTNWGLRDEATYYGDQAKAAPDAARELLKMPGALAGGLHDMVADMRWGSEPIAPEDPALAPVEGVDMDTAAAVDAALQLRRVARGDVAARDAVAREHGVPAGTWERVSAEWQSRRERDPRLLQLYAEAHRRHQKSQRSR